MSIILGQNGRFVYSIIVYAKSFRHEINYSAHHKRKRQTVQASTRSSVVTYSTSPTIIYKYTIFNKIGVLSIYHRVIELLHKMEYYTLSLIFVPIIFTTLFFLQTLSKSKLPPGPKPWPIIGSLHKLGDRPHRAVAELSKIYGPIMSLKLGTITTIVISSPEIVK